MKFHFITLGCKVNQYESEMMSELLLQKGYTPSRSFDDCDICVINTCTVTAVADAKNRKYIHRVRRENPDCVIVLCGCMTQAMDEAAEVFDECDIILGNTARKDIIPALEKFLAERKRLTIIDRHEKGEKFEPMDISGFSERTRAYIKIEDGCNRFCSYCIIPYARGRVRSKSLDDLKAEAQILADNGYREIVLVGINLSAYGQDTGSDIYEAVRTVCDIDGIQRVRLGSIEPESMTEDILRELSKLEKFCPHFHLSLQAGCDSTLKRMRRHYDTAEYARIVSDIRRYFDNPSITTDVMVGFAGESEEDFEKSVDFCDEIGFAKIHVFPYSRRKGTAADKMDGHIPENIKHARAEIMLSHAAVKQREFMQSQIGTRHNVLFEGEYSDGYIEGYSMNYTKIRVFGVEYKSGEVIEVKITEAYDDHCVGVPV